MISSYSIYLNESATNICSVIESFLRLFCEFKPIALIHFGFCRTISVIQIAKFDYLPISATMIPWCIFVNLLYTRHINIAVCLTLFCRWKLFHFFIFENRDCVEFRKKIFKWIHFHSLISAKKHPRDVYLNQSEIE